MAYPIQHKPTPAPLNQDTGEDLVETDDIIAKMNLPNNMDTLSKLLAALSAIRPDIQAGLSVAVIARKHNLNSAAIENWKAKDWFQNPPTTHYFISKPEDNGAALKELHSNGLITAGLDARVVSKVCDELKHPTTEEARLEKEYYQRLANESAAFEAVYHSFRNQYPELFSAPEISPEFGLVLTNVDVMVWLRKQFAPDSTILLSQGGMPGARDKNGNRDKAAPCWSLEEVHASSKKIATNLLGSYYTANVLHQEVREDRWKHAAFIGSCTRNLKTRWFKDETRFVWCDLETNIRKQRVPPTPEERVALLEYCRDHGASVVSMSPNGMHVLLILNKPVSLISTQPMKDVVQWFFRDFPQIPTGRWELDISACGRRTRLERACPVVLWNLNAVVELPAGLPNEDNNKTAKSTVEKAKKHPHGKSSGGFGSSGKSSAAGKKALGMRRAALHSCGVEHVSSRRFIARVAAVVGLKFNDLDDLFKKYPITSESFGLLDVVDTGRACLAAAPEWCQRQTNKLYASMSWIYTIIHSRTDCTPDELYKMLSGLLARPLVQAGGQMPPAGPGLPSHIVLPKIRPQALYKQAVLAAFSVTLKNKDNPADPQAAKARKALKLAEQDPALEKRLCGLLDRAELLMSDEDFLAWLQKDIARCARKYWGDKRGIARRLASKRRQRVVLLAMTKLADPENFSTSEIIALAQGKLGQHGYKKLSKTARAALKAGTRKKKVKKPRKKNVTQAIFRVLAQLEKDGLVTRKNPGFKAKNKVGRGAARWGITAMAVESGKWLKPNETKESGKTKECFKHSFVKGNARVDLLPVGGGSHGRSVTLQPVLIDGQRLIDSKYRGKGASLARVPMLCCCVRGYKAGTEMWHLEGHMPLSCFGAADVRFAPDVQACGFVRVRDLHLAQFACPKLFVSDGNGGQRELGPVDSYAGEFFALEISVRIDKNGKSRLQAAPAYYDAEAGTFSPAETVHSQPNLMPELYQPAAITWIKKLAFLMKSQAKWEKTLNIISRATLEAQAEQNPSRRNALGNTVIDALSSHFDAVPNGIIRWAAANWQPGSDHNKVRLLRGIQKIRRRKNKRFTKAGH
jgi:hypothetical protein